MQRAAPALVVAAEEARPVLPHEAVERGDEALLGREKGQVAHLQHRVLHVRGHDRKVLFIESDELEL